MDREDENDREAGQIEGIRVPDIENPKLVFEEGDLSLNTLFHMQEIGRTEVVVVEEVELVNICHIPKTDLLDQQNHKKVCAFNIVKVEKEPIKSENFSNEEFEQILAGGDC